MWGGWALSFSFITQFPLVDCSRIAFGSADRDSNVLTVGNSRLINRPSLTSAAGNTNPVLLIHGNDAGFCSSVYDKEGCDVVASHMQK